MGLKDIGETLPPGFRFYPSNEELVCHYLRKKIANEEALKGTLVEIDLHTCEPWQLPEVAKLNESEWYFFSLRDRKYATGLRTNRATACGYWKATGKDRVILHPNTRQVVGMRKTLVFYRNWAPNGLKTGWIMHEFRFQAPHAPPKEDWVLCRVFHKSKGESNTYNTDHLLDTIATTISTTSSPPPTLDPLPSTDIQGSAMVYGYQGSDYSSLTLNPSSEISTHDPNALYPPISLNPNQLLGDVIMVDDHHGDDVTDQYGLLWEMAFEEINNMGHGTPHGLYHHHHLHQFGDHIYGVNQ